MTTTLEILNPSYPETESPPQTTSTMTASAAYDGAWAVSEPFWEIVVDDRLAANPINHTDAAGLFASHVHSEIVQAAAQGLGIHPTILSRIEFLDVDVDTEFFAAKYGNTYWDDRYHALTKGWMALVRDKFNSVANWKCGWYYNDLLVPLAQALHTLQDFYTHTDWEDGNDLVTLYAFYAQNGQNGGRWALPPQPASSTNHHGQTIPMDALLAPDLSFENVRYFTGGGGWTGPWTYFFGDNSDHSRYSVDDAGKGREFRQIGYAQIGISGAFAQAKKDATTQTHEVLKWAVEHVRVLTKPVQDPEGHFS
jgi:hypothetical protein